MASDCEREAGKWQDPGDDHWKSGWIGSSDPPEQPAKLLPQLGSACGLMRTSKPNGVGLATLYEWIRKGLPTELCGGGTPNGGHQSRKRSVLASACTGHIELGGSAGRMTCEGLLKSACLALGNLWHRSATAKVTLKSGRIAAKSLSSM